LATLGLDLRHEPLRESHGEGFHCRIVYDPVRRARRAPERPWGSDVTESRVLTKRAGASD